MRKRNFETIPVVVETYSPEWAVRHVGVDIEHHVSRRVFEAGIEELGNTLGAVGRLDLKKKDLEFFQTKRKDRNFALIFEKTQETR